MKWNNLVIRKASNIKRARASVSQQTVKDVFSRLPPEDCFEPGNFYDYDETNLSDDPGAKKVIARRGTHGVDVVNEHTMVSLH